MGALPRAMDRDVSMSDRYELGKGEVFLTGTQALVRLLLDQRRADDAGGSRTAGFVTGYPGSPLAGLDLELARRAQLLGAARIVHRPGLNEELAATAIAGSQLASLQADRHFDGVVAMWYGKAPGLDRASDAIRHGNLMGTNRDGGVLVCVGDDPQARSSSVPSSSEPTLFALGIPVLSPADPQEVLDLGRHGIAMSRASGLWVGMRLSASVADASQTVVVGPDRVRPVQPDTTVDGEAFEHVVTAQLLGTTLLELERTLYGARLEIARRYAAANGLTRVVGHGRGAVLGIVAAGPAYLSVLRALRRIGIDDADLASAGIRLCRVGVVYPLDADVIREFAAGLEEVLVVEDKRSFLELQVKDALYGTGGAPRVLGKRDEDGRVLLAETGEVDADVLSEVLAARLLARREVRGAREFVERPRASPGTPPSLARGAYFCSGCPHNTGVKVPDGSSVGSGSGCHGLAIQMSPRQVGRVVGRFQMGGEGAMWLGMSPFVDAEHFIQNIGDGTFAHSGSLAVRAAVAAGQRMTFKLLVNSSVAMTGGQPVTGGRGLQDLCTILLAEGVSRVIVSTDEPAHARFSSLPAGVEVVERRRIVDAQRELANEQGVTVLIHDQACALDKRRKRRRGELADPGIRAFVNTKVCEGCGDCGAVSNCLSVHRVDTVFGERAQIHQESCNLDMTCLEGDCPALLSVAPGRAVRRGRSATPLPEPVGCVPGAEFTVRITGVGGTGVVTLAQVLAMAAHLEGRGVRGADQTGIAQKGGAVVSDLRIGTDLPATAHRLGAGECDLYLGCDVLVAADQRHLVAASPGRTVAVVSTARVPTGRQVADWTIEGPSMGELRTLIEPRTRTDRSAWLDVAELTRRELGSDVHANVALLGAAFQLGAVPLASASIERALELNGVDVEQNVRAFALGRLAISDPSSLAPPAAVAPRPDRAVEALVEAVGAAPGTRLGDLVAPRVADLVGYQDARYARRYVERVAAARAAESRLGRDDGPFAAAVAVELHRLMAVKDEFEVARLLLDTEVRAEIEDRFGDGAVVTYHLRPPALEALGLRRKLGVRRGAAPALRALRGMRRRRGGALDPFRWTATRRRDAELLEQYESTIAGLCDSLDHANCELAAELAGLPAMVRGFGAVRDASVRRYRERLAALLASG